VVKLNTFDKKEKESNCEYKERLRDEFYKVMVFQKYKGKNIVLRIEERDGYDTLDHITSDWKNGARIFNYNRAKFIINIPWILNKCDEENLIIQFKDGKREIIYLIEENNDFMIVLEEGKRSYALITAYKVNRSNSRDHFYKDKILELNEMEYSHNYNFTKIYKLKTNLKEIYIDENVKTWIEDFYTQDIIFRLIATALNMKGNKIIFMVHKNHYHVRNPDRNYVYLISKYTNTFQDKNLEKILEIVNSAISIMGKIYESDANNNTKFIKLYFKLESTIKKIAKSYGKCQLLYTCIKTIESEIGYFAPNKKRYKLNKQFPEILNALLQRRKSSIIDVFEKYKIEYEDSKDEVIITDNNLEKYYDKYLIGFLKDFLQTIYCSSS